VFSPTIGRQLLELGLMDEIDLHIVPVLLGDGIRRLEQQPRFAVHRPGNPVASPRSHGVPRRDVLSRVDPQRWLADFETAFGQACQTIA